MELCVIMRLYTSTASNITVYLTVSTSSRLKLYITVLFYSSEHTSTVFYEYSHATGAVGCRLPDVIRHSYAIHDDCQTSRLTSQQHISRHQRSSHRKTAAIVAASLKAYKVLSDRSDLQHSVAYVIPFATHR